MMIDFTPQTYEHTHTHILVVNIYSFSCFLVWYSQGTLQLGEWFPMDGTDVKPWKREQSMWAFLKIGGTPKKDRFICKKVTHLDDFVWIIVG